jgi:RHS repeat-associated protein
MANTTKFALALLATTALASPALAQSVTPAPTFVDAIDDHGVDLTTGQAYVSIEEGGIGSGPGRVAMQRIWAAAAGWTDNWNGGLYPVTDSNNVTKMYVQLSGISDTFSGSGSNWTSDKGDGATLILNADATWTYTARDGTMVKFDSVAIDNAPLIFVAGNCPGTDPSQCHVPLSITRPDGLKFTLAWLTEQPCQPSLPCYFQRLSSVTSSAGYKLTVSYLSDTVGDDNWFTRTAVAFTNTVNPPNPSPTISYAYPNFGATIDVTDPAGRAWEFKVGALHHRLTVVRTPGNVSDNITYAYGTDNTVSSVTKNGVTNSYTRGLNGTIATETQTNPLSQHRVVVTDINVGRPTSDKDGLNRTTTYEYDGNARLTKATAPEGNYTQLTYDARGNVTQNKTVSKTPGTPADVISSASYDATCTNIVKCNKPNNTTDPKGNVTDYTYDPTHGGVLTVTQPAPTTGAVRPQVRATYTQVTSASGDLVYMPTGASACQTLSSCTGGADETKSTLAYNSNLALTSVSQGDGTGALSAVSVMTYDARGNRLTVDGPLTGTADTTAYKYDSADQLIGVISADPDGAGSLKNRAIRLTYRPDGQVSKQEFGNTLGQSDSDFAAMTVSQTVDIGFDTNSRPVTSKLSASGTDYALTQTSYDALARVDCTAARMNTAIYGSLPASACTLGTQGSFGPDRISQIVYDNASEVTQAKVAVGTSDAATERTLTYSNNGKVTTLKDAENNLTTYEYDGFDRLTKMRFPDMAKGSGTSSTTDYEQPSYDANSNVTSRRLRDGNAIGFTRDNLNRVTLNDLPGSEPDVTYAYDNLGRVTSASQTGNALSFGWDALSRKLTEAGPQGTVGFAYDLAGRRTQITYPSTTSLTIDYTYLTTGELTAIKQGATSLATYGYDNLGNRTSVSFTNGASQAFTWDPVSRLASLTNNLSGTTNDLTATFAYNPASGITNTVRTGDAYAYTAMGSGTTAFTQNGLNQQITVGGSAAAWDSKGNLTSEPQSARTYGYSSENLLTSASGGVTLAYDPALRLYQVAGAATTRFLYDGADAIAEYNGSNALQRRFVFDPTTGQPVVWYEGTGTGSTSRRYLSADERGSVISVSSSTGASLGLNRYDEYGKPGAANLGRYQYTGQKWIGEAGIYDYKARDYLPHLGIFAQTDPIGYAGGANLYAYVGGDPVNLVDPFGLQSDCVDNDGDGQCDPNIVITGQVKVLRTFCELSPFSILCGGGLETDFAAPGSVGGGGGGGGGGGWGEPDPSQCPTASSIDAYLKSKGSPVVGLGQNFIDGGAAFNLDPRLPVAIMGAETTFGRRITSGNNNVFNNLYKYPASSPFDSYASAIYSEFKMLSGPNYAGLLGNTSKLYGKYCSGSDCSNGLNNLNKFLTEQGGDPNALLNPCLPGGK